MRARQDKAAMERAYNLAAIPCGTCVREHSASTPEVAPLAAPGTRAAGPWGRPWPPPECAPRGHSGQRRACVDPPRAAPRGSQGSRFPVRQVAARTRPPRPRSRPPRSPPGRGTENLESWQPGESANARQDPRFRDSQLADSRSRRPPLRGCASPMRGSRCPSELVLPAAAGGHGEPPCRAIKRA